MKPTYSILLGLLCIGFLAAVDNAQPLDQQNLQTLREYLLRREEESQPQQPPEAKAYEQDPAGGELVDTRFVQLDENEGDETGTVDERQVDESESYYQAPEERSKTDDDKKIDSEGAQSKPSKPKKFDELQVTKAEKYRFGGNGPFYLDFGVVATLEDGRSVLIRRVNAGGRCWGSTCDKQKKLSIISADDMTGNWELVASKEPEKSTVGDYANACQSADSAKAAADAMMKLD